jgi:hypothetical protein
MNNEEIDEILPPEVVDFVANDIRCKAFVAFGDCSLNMRTCLINLGKSPKVAIEYLPGFTRVTINNGEVWFDTTEQSATEIEALFETGKAPKRVTP